MMHSLLSDSANKGNERIHLILCDAIRKQYEKENEKLYLKQKVDTASVFNLLQRMFVAYQTLDSLDAKPNSKGRIKPKYRDKNAEFLNTYRKNLFSGGAFFIHKQRYQDGFNFMHTYIDCANQPLFSTFHYKENPEAAYWTVFCGYKLNNPEMTLKYADIALKDSAHLEYTMQYLAETYKNMEDTLNYERMLHEGFYRFRNSKYFFTYLIDYYNKENRKNLALLAIEDALKSDSTSLLFLYAKCNQLLNMGKYKESIEVCEKLIVQDSTFADAYYNAGVAYINMAFELEQSKKLTQRDKKTIKSFYEKSLPYMEKYRELMPKEKDKWAAALYNIYLQLNMGKQFEEIDKLLR
ncbi:MAG: hypothetical protein PUH24_04490 [Prevotellaceae bacterium]|nr:hypothetical protein [Prevotella sp.]MDD7257523.1 hypothetical protein [Prevotellaceae bacterium]MDY6130128.1 hypothetical protein [Prevotella sp.]